MTPVLRIRLLGAPAVTVEQRPISFRRRNAVAVLAYLTLSGAAVSRETLANLLAGESEQHLAFQVVRNAVAELREQLGPFLVISRQTLALNPELPSWSDVAELERLLAADGGADARITDQITALYSDELLAGFALRNAPAFGQWLEAERRRLRERVVYAWQGQLDSAIAADATEPALALAERIIGADPLAEATYRKAMQLLGRSGQRERALQLYERCRTSLAERLGVPPAPETTALYERLRSGYAGLDAMAHGDVALDPNLALLVGRLADPACRLVTLLAPREADATALALRAVAYYLLPGATPRLNPFADGVYLTSLSSPGEGGPAAGGGRRASAARAAGAIAGVNVEHELARALLSTVKHRSMLLVLDGLTPTEAEIEAVVAILQAAPRVKLLVVARTRLFLREEWIFDVV